VAPKIPRNLLRTIKAQKKALEAEGEIEVTERKLEMTEGYDPAAAKERRSQRRSAKAYARMQGPRKVRTFPYQEGDLVEIKRVPWNARGVTTGSFGIVLETLGGGERVTIQVGNQVISMPGVDLRMPWEDEEE
tara:strand:- start:3926 stop:4324 length:399 start_codon:yes stop_codon:yes gene_type:complete